MLCPIDGERATVNTPSFLILLFLVQLAGSASFLERSFGQEMTAERLYLNALRTCETKMGNVAALSRRRFTRLGAIPASRTESMFSIHCNNPSATKSSENCFYMTNAEAFNSDQFGNYELSPSTKLFSQIGDRSFSGSGGGLFDGSGKTYLEVGELTSMMKEQKTALTIGNLTRTLKINMLALPFLSYSAIWTGSDFSTAHHQFRISRPEYEIDDGETCSIVFSLHNRSCVKKYFLDKNCNFMPTKMELYLRPESKSSIAKSDSLGTMLHRTSIEWNTIDSKPKADSHRFGDSDSKNGRWFPMKIILEEFPSKSKPDHTIIEIDSQWEMNLDNNCLTAEAVLQQISPNPIQQIYLKLGSKLESHIDEMDKKKNRVR